MSKTLLAAAILLGISSAKQNPPAGIITPPPQEAPIFTPTVSADNLEKIKNEILSFWNYSWVQSRRESQGAQFEQAIPQFTAGLKSRYGYTGSIGAPPDQWGKDYDLTETASGFEWVLR